MITIPQILIPSPIDITTKLKTNIHAPNTITRRLGSRRAEGCICTTEHHFSSSSSSSSSSYRDTITFVVHNH